MLSLGLVFTVLFSSLASAVIAPGGFDYINEAQGFYIVMPAGWDDYSVKEEDLGIDIYFDFSLPTTDTSGNYPDGTVRLFTITATSGDPVEMAEYLGENIKYKF